MRFSVFFQTIRQIFISHELQPSVALKEACYLIISFELQIGLLKKRCKVTPKYVYTT